MLGKRVVCRPITLGPQCLFPPAGTEKHPIRRGTVVYAHPKGRYVTVAFEEAGGKTWLRESFATNEVQIIKRRR